MDEKYVITDRFKKEICDKMDKMIREKNFSLSEQIVGEFSSDDGNVAVMTWGEITRLERVANIIMFENKYGYKPFCYECNGIEEAMNRYCAGVFMLRRMCFPADEEMICEAKEYFAENSISPFMAYFMANFELMTANANAVLESVVASIWNGRDRAIYMELCRQ